MKKLIFVSALIGLCGCSSSPKIATPENTEDVVISRIDGLSKRPNWINEQEPFRIENGMVISTGMTTIPAENRIEAAYRIAQNNAKSAIAGAISQRLSFVLQNAEENTTLDNTQANYIGAEASDLITNYIRPHKNYWEKIAETNDSGQRVTKYRVFSTVTMPEAEFKRSILAAIQKAQGKQMISSDFRKKVDAHWDTFVNGSAQQPDSREPSQTSAE